MNYIDFATKISFYEFLQSEFKAPHFNTDNYKQEIELLQSHKITIEYLMKILQQSPKAIDIFEELLQLKRFTDAQYINFCFDVNVLNNAEQPVIVKYIKTRVFKFEDGEPNSNFTEIYAKITSADSLTDKELIFYTKRAIATYIKKVLKSREIFYEHMHNSIAARLRIAKYLIENLNAAEYLSSTDLEIFLQHKRHPVDTKGLHGNFGIMKISKILEDAGFVDATSEVGQNTLSLQPLRPNSSRVTNLCYVREKAVEGINKRKDNKPKRFDFILLSNGRPKVLIETNFYSTSGTKIGINQGEYVDLHEDIQKFNLSRNTDFCFIWITDGNYWLSRDGEGRFTNLKNNYFKDEFELLNYNLFREALPKIKQSIM